MNNSLPDGVTYQGNAEMAYNVWSVLEAVEYRWTINEVLQQPAALLNDVIMIAALHRKMRRLEEESNNA